MKSLLEQYVHYHPDFLESLSVFPAQVRNRLIRRLSVEKEKSNFLSTVAEIRFGRLFLDLGFDLEYDKQFSNNQRPDWLIKLGNSVAICDVYRLGKSRRDQLRGDFENRLVEKLESIPKNCLLKIEFIDEYFDTTKYDVDVICELVRNWLMSPQKEFKQTLSLFDNFEFKVIKENTSTPHVTCIGNCNSIEIKNEKVKQLDTLKPNEITKKLHKYDEIISANTMPYFIGIYIDFTSGFEPEEIREVFVGHGVEFIDFGTTIATENFSHLGQEWTELGEFYNNLQLSGFVTFYNERFQLIRNPRRAQIIYADENRHLLARLNRIE